MTAPTTAQPARALYQQVAEQLRARIFAHELPPGSWIDEQSLAAELGISRTPFREALKVLAAEGLVEMRVRRGAYVARVSQRDLADVYHLLGLLEGDAAAELAVNASATQLAELGSLHDELEASVADANAFFAANERFHLRLLEMADNRWRRQMVDDLRKVMKLNRHQSLLREGRIDASLQEHRVLLDALRRRDAARAQELMREHISRGRDAAIRPGNASPA